MKRLVDSIRQIKWGFVLICLATACQKDDHSTPEPAADKLREVTFRLNQFQSGVFPLSAIKDPLNSISTWDVSIPGNVTPSPHIQDLYYWSFNDETTKPDIAIDFEAANIAFTSNSSTPKYSFTTGFSYDSFPAGKAYNIAALDALWFEIPVQHVEQLVSFAFDVSSSNTGPKDFIFYVSVNDGDYTVLSANNQFIDTKANGKNSYVYDLTQLQFSEKSQKISFKIEAQEGERGEGAGYNEKSGTFKIDNVRLSGVYSGQQNEPEIRSDGQLYYHIFSAQDSLLVLSGQVDINLLSDDAQLLSIKLKEGQYFASFAADFSTDSLRFSDLSQHSKDFYWYYPFADAHTFGTVLNSFNVDDDLMLDLTLVRCFSQVRFEFTDTEGLDQIGEIEILPLSHTAFAPFALIKNIPQTFDYTFRSEIQQSDKGYYLQFNQFMGFPDDPRLVAFLVRVFGKDDVLMREFAVETSILNNVQLIFTGNLLEKPVGETTGFEIKWNKSWNEPVIINF